MCLLPTCPRVLLPRIDRSRVCTPPRLSSNALSILGGALANIDRGDAQGWQLDEPSGAWMKLPRTTPWACVHFIGGAGFGVAPQLCYDVLLSTLVERLGVAVIATPYDLGTDHWKIAKRLHGDFETALGACRDTCGIASTAPTFRLGHSLGAKLAVLGALGDDANSEPLPRSLPGCLDASEEDGAVGQARTTSPPVATDPIGLLAFNNFGLTESAAYASEFLSRMGGSGGGRDEATARAVMEAFGMARQVAAAVGVGDKLEVSPSPQELERLVNTGLTAASTTLWRFSTDDFDCSDGLLESLPGGAESALIELEGSHLTPVVFRLEAAEIDPALELLLGSGRGFSFGSREAVAPLCDAVCDWLWPSPSAPPPMVEAASSGVEELGHGREEVDI